MLVLFRGRTAPDVLISNICRFARGNIRVYLCSSSNMVIPDPIKNTPEESVGNVRTCERFTVFAGIHSAYIIEYDRYLL